MKLKIFDEKDSFQPRKFFNNCPLDSKNDKKSPLDMKKAEKYLLFGYV